MMMISGGTLHRKTNDLGRDQNDKIRYWDCCFSPKVGAFPLKIDLPSILPRFFLAEKVVNYQEVMAKLPCQDFLKKLFYIFHLSICYSLASIFPLLSTRAPVSIYIPT